MKSPDVGQASPQMRPVLDHGCVEAIFPESTIAIASPIVGLRMLTLDQLHQPAHVLR